MPRKSTPKAAPAAGTSQHIRQALEGMEKRCRRCLDWWPADVEFFFGDARSADGLFYACKACYREWQATTGGKSRRPREDLSEKPPSPVALACITWLGSQRLDTTTTNRSPT